MKKPGFSISLSKEFITLGQKIRKEAATIIANIIEEEFVNLLRNAPQYSGNYVANFQLTASGGRSLGGIPTSGSGIMYFPGGYDTESIMRRGSMPAISIALQNSSTFKGAFISQSEGSWSGGGFKITNKLDYAQKVEDADPNWLREGSAGAHALARAEARLRKRFAATIEYDSAEWRRYAGGRE